MTRTAHVLTHAKDALSSIWLLLCLILASQRVEAQADMHPAMYPQHTAATHCCPGIACLSGIVQSPQARWLSGVCVDGCPESSASLLLLASLLSLLSLVHVQMHVPLLLIRDQVISTMCTSSHHSILIFSILIFSEHRESLLNIP